MENLEIYEKVRKVPESAKKAIGGGRLKGMTDINPMWRIKTLTETFGAAGLGWYYDITDKRLEKGANDEIACFVEIHLFVKIAGEWSKPIAGIGGSAFIAKEKSGLFTSDECFKMALTDAISVACKALGVAADVYFEKDLSSKYETPPQAPKADDVSAMEKRTAIEAWLDKNPTNMQSLLKYYNVGSFEDLNQSQVSEIYSSFKKKNRI